MMALPLKIVLALLPMYHVFAAQSDSTPLTPEQTKLIDEYLLKTGLFAAVAAPPSIDLQGRVKGSAQQLNQVAVMVTNNTSSLVQGMNRLSQFTVKHQKPNPILYDDPRAARDLRDEVVRECCSMKESGK